MILYREDANANESKLVVDLLEFLKTYNLSKFDLLWRDGNGQINIYETYQTLKNFKEKFFNLTEKSQLQILLAATYLRITISPNKDRQYILNVIDNFLITLNIKGENKSDQLITLINDFINNHPITDKYRTLIKISNCSYRYSLDTPLYMEKNAAETFQVYYGKGTFSKTIIYDTISGLWIDTKNKEKFQNIEYLYQYRKAITFLETLVLYIKIKLVFSANDIPQDVIFHMIYLYCQRSKITDIKIV
jgi:hypothetical protein